MKELYINDSEAQRLIKILKRVIESVNGVLTLGSRGEIKITSIDNHSFVLSYYYSENKKTFNLRELKYNYNLIRINLDNNFHKNADGQIIRGNRINIFSYDEYYKKADGVTHQKSYPLPFDTLSNSTDFTNMLFELLEYSNVENCERINLSLQESIL